MRFIAFVVVSVSLISNFCLAAPTPVAHADNPVARTEHEAMLDLVREADATHVAVKSGPWSAPSTWKQNSVPGAGESVLIGRDIIVTVDAPIIEAFRGVRVEGTLRWETQRDATLLVDTVLVVPGGKIEIGSVEHPIANTAHARLVFADSGPLDTVRDPMIMGRGLISHGVVRMCGAEITPFATLARPARQGDKSLLLTASPKNWNKGDKLILPGVMYQEPDEELTVQEVRGAEIFVAPLANDHLPPVSDVAMYVANVTRNICLESQNTKDVSRRGHVMFMHNGDVDLHYVGFTGLGRTDKIRELDDPKLDEKGHLIAGTGTNPRGRYAVHFHRTGTGANKPTAIVKGCAVVDSPGWGFVNHSSHVDFDGNVAFNVFGSAFVTEAGDEVGVFRNNFAIRGRAQRQYGEDERKKIQDFAFEGDGFWFQGAGITVEDNIACGQRSSGFIYFTAGLIEEGLGTARFAVANLWKPEIVSTIRHLDGKDPKQINDPDSVPVIAVPVKSFKRNVAFACGTGFTSRFVQPEPNRSAYEDGTVWNCDYGVRVRYTSHLDLRNLRLIGNPRSKSGSPAIAGTLEGEQDIRYENLRVEGWGVGIEVPEVGHHVIADGFYNNASSIKIPSPMARGRKIEITGDIKFGTLDAGALHGRPQYDIDLDARFAPMLDGAGGYRDPNVLFASDTILINTGPHRAKQLYFFEQEAGYVPFPRDVSMRNFKQMGRTVGAVPEELIDISNAHMSQEYGLAIGGAVVPPGSSTDPRIHALISAPTPYADDLRLSAIRTPQLQAAHFTCYHQGNKQQITIPALDLHAGWNLVTQVIEQHKRSFLVFGGDAVEAEKKYKDKNAKY